MAVLHGSNCEHDYNSAALETTLRSAEVNIDQDLVDSTCMGDNSKEFTLGVYGWTMGCDYLWDPAASQNDVTIHGQLGASSAVAIEVFPGGGSKGATNPAYNGSAWVRSYRVTIPHDGMITSRADYQGNGALTRATS